MGDTTQSMEAKIKRNPHPDFKAVEQSRPEWTQNPDFKFTQTKKTDWKLGGGANDNGETLDKKHIEIDPFAEGRQPVFNYKLLISAVIPRPIGFLGTRSADGSSTNLAPFSFFNVVNFDPPVFIVGFTGGVGKDSLVNLKESGECSINIISEHFVEAANASSIDAPYGTSEWALTGLHPAPCTDIKASRVKEAIFSIEAKLMNSQVFESRATPGKQTGELAVIEGIRFWAREDAVNEELSLIDPSVLRPVSRMGGITYGRVTEGFEMLRPDFAKTMASGDYEHLKKPKTEEQSQL